MMLLSMMLLQTYRQSTYSKLFKSDTVCQVIWRCLYRDFTTSTDRGQHAVGCPGSPSMIATSSKLWQNYHFRPRCSFWGLAHENLKQPNLRHPRYGVREADLQRPLRHSWQVCQWPAALVGQVPGGLGHHGHQRLHWLEGWHWLVHWPGGGAPGQAILTF